MRFLAVAIALCLGACVGQVESLAPTEPGDVSQNREPGAEEGCAKLAELEIGMTTAQVLLSCEHQPIRTSNVITRDGKLQLTWVYKGSYLHFADGKLARIQNLQ